MTCLFLKNKTPMLVPSTSMTNISVTVNGNSMDDMDEQRAPPSVGSMDRVAAPFLRLVRSESHIRRQQPFPAAPEASQHQGVVPGFQRSQLSLMHSTSSTNLVAGFLLPIIPIEKPVMSSASSSSSASSASARYASAAAAKAASRKENTKQHQHSQNVVSEDDDDMDASYGDVIVGSMELEGVPSSGNEGDGDDGYEDCSDDDECDDDDDDDEMSQDDDAEEWSWERRRSSLFTKLRERPQRDTLVDLSIIREGEDIDAALHAAHLSLVMKRRESFLNTKLRKTMFNNSAEDVTVPVARNLSAKGSMSNLHPIAEQSLIAAEPTSPIGWVGEWSSF